AMLELAGSPPVLIAPQLSHDDVNEQDAVADGARLPVGGGFPPKAFTSSRPTELDPLLFSTTRSRVVLTGVNVTVLYWLAATGYPLAPGTATYELPFQYCRLHDDGRSMP